MLKAENLKIENILLIVTIIELINGLHNLCGGGIPQDKSRLDQLFLLLALFFWKSMDSPMYFYKNAWILKNDML